MQSTCVALHVTQVSNTDLTIMNSRRPSSFIAQLLFLILSWFVQLSYSRGKSWQLMTGKLVTLNESLSDVNDSGLVQLDDCTCLGYTQTFECSVFGGRVTIWSSMFF